MKFWQVLSFTEPDQLVDLAPLAEDAGFHGILLSDHLFFPGALASKYPYSEDGKPGFSGTTPFPEPFTTISAMSARTSKLRFATMVYILPLRHPLEVAKTVGTAALITRGRVTLGCGAGWIREEFDALGVEFRTRGRRFNEMIPLLRELWSGRMIEHHGEFFDLGPLQMSPAPEVNIPIYIGGVSPAAFQRAATLGDGWIGTGQHPDEVPGILASLRTLREAAGRADEPFEAIVPLTVPPELELFRRLESEHGMAATTCWPFHYTLGATSSLLQKRDAMRRFGDEVISKLG